MRRANGVERAGPLRSGPGGHGVSAVDDIKLYFFHHHHYIPIPEDHERFATAMVDYPNTQYDPEVGHELYKRHFRSIMRAAQLGFDGICLNEHHSMAYSM